MGKTTGICNLCLENKPLDKGHILPKWSGRLSGKGSVYNTFVNDISHWQDSSTQEPKGLPTERLFCGECDKHLGLGEQLLREIIHPSRHKPSCISEAKDFTIELKGKAKIEQLYAALGGLLLKSHLTKDELWGHFSLTENQAETIRRGIRNSDLSRNIDFNLYKIYNLEDFKINPLGDVNGELDRVNPFGYKTVFPLIQGEDSTATAVLIFGGLLLTLRFYSEGFVNPRLSPHCLRMGIFLIDMKYLLNEQGPLNFKRFPSYIDMLDMRSNMLKTIPLDAKCPCNVYTTNKIGIKENPNFGDCCYKYWGLDKTNYLFW